MQKAPRRFTIDEDAILIKSVEQFGKEWDIIATCLNGRNARQCRERYQTYLAPNINRSPWTNEEDNLLKEKHQIYGNHWAVIATFFQGRSDNQIKNRWHVLNRQMKMPAINPILEVTPITNSQEDLFMEAEEEELQSLPFFDDADCSSSLNMNF